MDGKLNELSNKIFKEADYTQLSPSKQRYLFETLQANLFRHISVHPDLAIRMKQYQTEIENFTKDLETKQEELRDKYPEINTKNNERKKLKQEIGPLLVRTVPQLDTLFEKTKENIERGVNRVEDLTKRRNDIDAELNAATPPPFHRKFILNQQRAWTDSQIQKQRVADTENVKRLKELHVHRVIAKEMDAATKPRRDWASFDQTATDAKFVGGSIAQINNKNRGVVHINLSKAEAIALRDEASSKVERDEILENEINTGHADSKKLIKEIGDLDAKIRKLEEFGVSGVNINAKDMYDSVDVNDLSEPAAEILSKTRDERAAVLLGQVFDERGQALGIPLEFIFGKAGKIADERIEKWISRRVNHDEVYLKSVEKGENIEAVQAYERYLEQVGLNEIFMRAMIKEEGDGDKLSPLHLSLDESQDIDRYLEERERLVSFTQFLEIWEGIPNETDRAKYLP